MYDLRDMLDLAKLVCRYFEAKFGLDFGLYHPPLL
jgi:hypothetical protein